MSGPPYPSDDGLDLARHYLLQIHAQRGVDSLHKIALFSGRHYQLGIMRGWVMMFLFLDHREYRSPFSWLVPWLVLIQFQSLDPRASGPVYRITP